MRTGPAGVFLRIDQVLRFSAQQNTLILPGREAVQCADVSSTLTRTISGNGRERRAVRDQRRRAILVRLPGRGR
jgi:hypothetical protein